jgi:broad specificity phosphatase PhoE
MPELTKLLREFDAGDRGDLPVGTSAEEAHRIKCAQTGVVSAMALGERKEDIIARVHAFVQHVLEAAVSGDEPVEVVVVSHGGFIKTFLQTLLGRPVDRVNNTSVSVVRLETKSNSSRAQGIKYSATAESLNDLSHLTKDVATTSSAW